MSEDLGSESSVIEKMRPLEEILRKEDTRKGLDIICRKGDKQDLSRVRKLAKSDFVDYSNCDLEYLRKFGEWKDIPLVISMLNKKESGITSSLITKDETDKYRSIARTIYRLGRTRLEELLSLEQPDRLLANLIVESSDKVFGDLGDKFMMQLFDSEHDDVRKATVLKCIRALPKHRLAGLLEDYTSNKQHRYYNVIHWLDLGDSIPRDRARSAAETAIVEAWRT
jgi:hypothetical protein